MALTQIDDRGLKTPIDLLDNEKIRLGTGNDLETYHDGSHSYLINSTGDLLIKSDVVYLKGTNNENYFVGVANGRTELYYDNSKKLETTSGGVTLHNDVLFDNGTNADKDIFFDASANLLEFSDDVKASFGNGEDLKIYHDGTNSKFDNTTGKFLINTSANLFGVLHGSDDAIISRVDGAVELYYDNSKKFETTSAGATVTGDLSTTGDVNFDGYTAGRDMLWDRSRDSLVFKDNAYAEWGTGTDLQIYHDGSNSFIKDSGTGDLRILSSQLNIQNAAGTETQAYFDQDGACALYHNGTRRIITTNEGAQTDGHHDVVDSHKFRCGNGQDLQIYHDGSNSHVRHTGTGDLYIEGGAGNAADVRIDAQTHVYMHVNGNESALFAEQNGPVYLYHDGTERFSTTSSGAKVTGNPNSAIDLLIENTNNSQNAAVARLRIHGGDAANQGPYIELDRNGAYHQIEEDAGGNLDFSDNGTVKFVMESDGTFYIADGDLHFGTAGHGIDFSAQTASSATGATTSSELLDHYEEGSWTAAVEGGSSAGSTRTYSSNDCWYTKIGRQVNICFYVNWTNFNGSGHLHIGGMPFSPATNNQVAGGVMTNNLDLPGQTNDLAGVVTHTWGGVSYFRLYTYQDNGGWQAVQCDDTGAIIGQLTYFTS